MWQTQHVTDTISYWALYWEQAIFMILRCFPGYIRIESTLFVNKLRGTLSRLHDSSVR